MCEKQKKIENMEIKDILQKSIYRGPKK